MAHYWVFLACCLLVCGAGALPAVSSISPTDLVRASTRIRPGWHADHHQINSALQADWVRTANCSGFSRAELASLTRTLLDAAAPELDQLYAAAADPRALRLRSRAAWESEWAADELLQEGMCAEIAMLWAHHVPEPAKQLIKRLGLTLPLVPAYRPAQSKPSYDRQFNCVTGHNNQESGWNSSASSYANGWPAEVQYGATGYGPYPFWLGPVTADITQGAPIRVWWSRTQQAEKFYHEVCQVGNAGYSKAWNSPCYHLMLGGGEYKMSYFYTAKQDFCCISGFNDKSGEYQSQVLTAVQFDWMKKMTLNGESDYVGKYYQGRVKNYTMDCSGGCGPGNFLIWYYTTLDDKPVEQGEGCQVMPRTSQCSTGGSYLFHQYNLSSWSERPIDKSTFDIPEVCKQTKSYCLFP